MTRDRSSNSREHPDVIAIVERSSANITACFGNANLLTYSLLSSVREPVNAFRELCLALVRIAKGHSTVLQYTGGPARRRIPRFQIETFSGSINVPHSGH